MNENLNLVEILKNCPKGTKLYSPLVGTVIFQYISESIPYPIITSYNDDLDDFYNFTKEGKYYANKDGECLLFPSKDQRDWSKFKTNKPKFDPATLNPFDKVIVKDLGEDEVWQAAFFSHIGKGTFPFVCSGSILWRKCIPYNEDTKHLVGTTEEAPEFYRYWED